MDSTTHVCLGSCHASINDKLYKEGIIACGNDLCEKKGTPFVPGHKCPQCDQTYREGTIHQCNSER